jgi:hypothetical protein
MRNFGRDTIAAAAVYSGAKILTAALPLPHFFRHIFSSPHLRGQISAATKISNARRILSARGNRCLTDGAALMVHHSA